MAPADFPVNYLLSSFFDTVVLAVLDRCHLAMDVVERVPSALVLPSQTAVSR
jgi:hypothetical protein